MRILIIGGAGLLGLELARLYVENGHDVALYDNFTGSITYRVPSIYQISHGNACDYTALNSVCKIYRPEYIIVALNYCFNRDTIYDPGEDSRTILHSTSSICSVLKDDVKKVLFCSSHEVYGGPESRTSLKESRKIKLPSTAHGAAKLASENIFKFHCAQKNIDLINFRLFNIYGPRIKFTPRSCVINFLIDSFLRNEAVAVSGPSLNRDFIHVRDVAEVMYKIEQSGFTGEINVGSGNAMTLSKVVTSLQNHLGTNEAPIYIQSSKMYSSVADLTKLKSIIPNWKPSIDLLNYLPELIEFRKAELEFFSIKDPIKVLNTMRGK